MNKLVSKNPVLRFKLGKKIVKALGGITLNILGHKTEVGPTASKFLRKIKGAYDYYNANSGATEDFGLMHGRTGNPITFIRNIIDGNTKNPNLKTVQQLDTPVTGKMVSSDSPLSNINRAIDNYVDGMNQRKKLGDFGLKPGYPSGFKAGYNDYGNSQSSTSKKTITKPINNRWVNGIQKRDEITDVRATQQMLKDAGFDIGKYGVDGKWGKDTENAYRQYLALKNIPIHEKTPEQTVDISSPSKVLNSTVVNQEPLTPELQTELNIVNNNLQTASNPLIPEQKVFARNGNYNKSQIRELMRQNGLNPYSFSGSDRKALRQWLNGETDDWGRLAFKNSRLYDAFVRPYGYKQGGQLVSRNPVKRFKNKKK